MFRHHKDGKDHQRVKLEVGRVDGRVEKVGFYEMNEENHQDDQKQPHEAVLRKGDESHWDSRDEAASDGDEGADKDKEGEEADAGNVQEPHPDGSEESVLHNEGEDDKDR